MRAEIIASNRQWRIYALRDPESRAIRYVGCTYRSLAVRLRQHYRSTKDQSYRARWIRSVRERGQRPVIEQLESGYGPGVHEAEQRWIQKLRGSGCRLTNTTDGGGGILGYAHTAETKERLSGALKGRKVSRDIVDRVASANRANKRKLTHAEIERLRAANLGRKLTPEHREKLINATRTRVWTDEQKADASKRHTGRTVSLETRDKLRDVLSGRKHTETACQKMRDAWAKRKAERTEFPEMGVGRPGRKRKSHPQQQTLF